MRSYTVFKRKLLRDKEIKRAYDALAPEFELAQMIIEKRIKRGFTQAALARKIGTKQSAIARLESGTYNPTVKFLQKVGRALNAEVRIRIQ